jgi:hypothetical protein
VWARRGNCAHTQRSRELVTYSVNMTHVAKIELWVYAPHPFKLGMWSPDSVVGIATSYGLDDRGVGVLVSVEPRTFSTLFRPALGSTQSPIQWVPGALSPAGAGKAAGA